MENELTDYEKCLIKVWCKLDSAWGALDKTYNFYNVLAGKTKELERRLMGIKQAQTVIGVQREIIMQRLKYIDYDEFVEHLMYDLKIKWNSLKNDWEV